MEAVGPKGANKAWKGSYSENCWKQLRIWLRTLIRGVAVAFSIFAQVSRSETVRLKTNAEGEASGSTQK